jgi:acetolactate synthase-1/2/3 large subunit
MRVTEASQLDDAIRAMLAHPGPVIADIAVAKDENCFPMIPSGAAHNEMILAPGQQGGVAGVTDEGKVLV